MNENKNTPNKLNDLKELLLKNKKFTLIGGGAIALLVVILIVVFAISGGVEEDVPAYLPVEPTTVPVTVPTDADETTAPTTVPEPTEPGWEHGVLLDWLEPYYEENNSLIGWIRVPGTVIDFPIYQTGEQYADRTPAPYGFWDYYLRHNRDHTSGDGEIYIWPPYMHNGDVTMEDAEILFVFGHNFRYFHNLEIHRGADGEIRQFSEIPYFEDQDFFDEHREIFMSTRYQPDMLFETSWIFELDSVVDANGYADIHFVNPETGNIAPTIFNYLLNRTFADEAAFDEFVRLMDHYSIISADNVQYGDRFVILLTCQNRNYISSRRLALVGRYRPEN